MDRYDYYYDNYDDDCGHDYDYRTRPCSARYIVNSATVLPFQNYLSRGYTIVRSPNTVTNHYYVPAPAPAPVKDKSLSLSDLLHNPGLSRNSIKTMLSINRPRITAYLTECFPMLKEALASLTYKSLIAFSGIPDFRRIYYDVMTSLGLENYCSSRTKEPLLHKSKLDRDDIIAEVLANFSNIVSCMEAKKVKIPPTLVQQMAPSERALIEVFLKWVKEESVEVQEAYRYALICVGLRDLLPGYPDPTPEVIARRQALVKEQKSVEKAIEYAPSPVPSPAPGTPSPVPSPAIEYAPSPVPSPAPEAQTAKRAEGYALDIPSNQESPAILSSALVNNAALNPASDIDAKFDASCTICMARRSDTVLGCTHVYCAVCIKDVKLCPHCRADITTRTLIHWP